MSMSYEIEQRPEMGSYATFVPNKLEPIYNWFYFKEGFSKQMVEFFLNEFGLKDGMKVLDPFCGCGATLLACRQRGINAIGVDVMPCTLLASRVKTRDYNTSDLREEATRLFSHKFQKPSRMDIPPPVKRCFTRYALEDIIFFKGFIARIDDTSVREFFLLALINATMKVSWAWKDGGVIKVKKHPAPPLKKLYRRVVSRWVKDMEKLENKPASIEIMKGDARRLENVESGSIDAVITSPPYLNQIDYTKVYIIENWIAGGEISPPLRSFIGLGVENIEVQQTLANQNLHPDAITYFNDMSMFLDEIYRVMKSGAKAAIVLGNAYFPPPYSQIESDVALAELAKSKGFRVEKILVLNKRAALVKRVENVGTLRESAVILKKA
jgi:DNA modification methylase